MTDDEAQKNIDRIDETLRDLREFSFCGNAQESMALLRAVKRRLWRQILKLPPEEERDG